MAVFAAPNTPTLSACRHGLGWPPRPAPLRRMMTSRPPAALSRGSRNRAPIAAGAVTRCHCLCGSKGAGSARSGMNANTAGSRRSCFWSASRSTAGWAADHGCGRNRRRSSSARLPPDAARRRRMPRRPVFLIAPRVPRPRNGWSRRPRWRPCPPPAGPGLMGNLRGASQDSTCEAGERLAREVPRLRRGRRIEPA